MNGRRNFLGEENFLKNGLLWHEQLQYQYLQIAQSSTYAFKNEWVWNKWFA